MVDVTTAFEAQRPSFVMICVASVRRTFANNFPLYICAVLFAAATYSVARYFRVPADIGSSLFFLEMGSGCLVVSVTLIALYGLIGLMRRGFPGSPSHILGKQMLGWFQEGDRPGNIIHTLVTFAALEISFTTLKESVPQIHPFSWDRTFTQWDRFIGFGHLPWEILQPALGFAPVTMLINFAYDFWFVVVFGCLFWQAFSAKGGTLRLQFLLAFSFAWFIGGNLLATVFSSAGPCFYGLLYPGHDPYAAQMAYLHGINKDWPIWSVDVQQTLWKGYAAGHGAFGGISAMPSMHVTIAILAAIWGWRVNHTVGWALSAYATVIVVGSVHLAWHYAVDGIAGIGLAMLFWVAAGAIARACERYCARRSIRALGTTPDVSPA